MPRTRTPIDDLRLAIDCLPLRTRGRGKAATPQPPRPPPTAPPPPPTRGPPAPPRGANREGRRQHDIIVGAGSDRHGGMCPMLAAHRHGGRTSFVSFAHAWDRF